MNHNNSTTSHHHHPESRASRFLFIWIPAIWANHMIWTFSPLVHTKLSLPVVSLLLFFKKKIEDISLLWDHWLTSFELVVTSVLGFKARVDTLLACFLRLCLHAMDSSFTSGATPADLLTTRMAAEVLGRQRSLMNVKKLCHFRSYGPFTPVIYEPWTVA